MQSHWDGGASRNHEPRAVAAIASRFNRVEPSHGQEAFASASTASPQLACRLAATPGHESGLTPDTNRHEKLGISTQGSGARSWRAELFSFPVPHSCSLRSRRIRVPRNIPRAKRAAPAVARGVPHSCRALALICRHIWNRICGIDTMPTCRAFVHKTSVYDSRNRIQVPWSKP